MKDTGIAGILILTICAALFTIAVFRRRRYRSLLANGVKVTGRGSGVDDGNEGTELVVEYEDSEGNLYHVRSLGANSSWAGLREAPMTVLYERDNPRRAVIEEDIRFGSRMFLWVCGPLAAVGAGLLIHSLI